MRKLTLNFLLISAAFLMLPAAQAYTPIGPVAVGGDGWQTTSFGFNPLPALNPSTIADLHDSGPKNIGEGFRRNTPVMYYTMDQTYLDYFGSNGTNAIIGAFNILNGLTNVDNYSADLTEFPLQATAVNYAAQALGLVDIKSLTLTTLMGYLGIGDSVRYTWVLHSRWHTGNIACPVGELYNVAERNYDIHTITPLTQSLYSPYVNNALYTYTIWESCTFNPNPFPAIDAMVLPLAADPLNDNPPVASGNGFGSLDFGEFYSGLTRDDVAGLRSLYRAANVNTENPAAGALLQPSGGTTVQLNTEDLGLLVDTATSTDPVTLSAEFPNLVITSVTTNYVLLSWQTNIITYLTNFPGSAYGSPQTAVATTQIVPLVPKQYVPQYSYTFGNVITNSYNPVASAYVMTVSNLTILGSAYNPTSTNILGTNVMKLTTTNFPSGDYYLIPPGVCGYSILQSATNVIYTTNLVLTVTNGPYFISQSIIYAFTNHSYLAQQISCTGSTAPAGKYEGIEQMQYVYVDPGNYDTFSGRFIVPITNDYTMSLVVHTNGVDTVTIQKFRRVVTTPDFVFSAQDLVTQGGADALEAYNNPNWNEANMLPGLAGPGTIDPSNGTNAQIVFNKAGPIYGHAWPLTDGPNDGTLEFTFASFDGTTNAPVIYPNGTSISDVQNQVFIQLLPATLPNATHGIAYNATLGVNGGTGPYTWTLAPGSTLPAGFTLSSGGIISGTTTQYGLFDFVVKMTDSASPAHIVQKDFTLTIN